MNLARILNALAKNSSLELFSVRLSDSSLTAGKDNIIFTDRSDELCDALENGIGKNQSIINMELVNLRLCNSLIDYIGKGLKTNTQLKSLNISGNLMVKSINIIIGLAWLVNVVGIINIQ